MFGKIWEMKKMYDKYKTLQKALQNLVIRAKEWKYVYNGETLEWAIVVDITWEMKLGTKSFPKSLQFLQIF